MSFHGLPTQPVWSIWTCWLNEPELFMHRFCCCLFFFVANFITFLLTDRNSLVKILSIVDLISSSQNAKMSNVKTKAFSWIYLLKHLFLLETDIFPEDHFRSTSMTPSRSAINKKKRDKVTAFEAVLYQLAWDVILFVRRVTCHMTLLLGARFSCLNQWYYIVLSLTN